MPCGGLQVRGQLNLRLRGTSCAPAAAAQQCSKDAKDRGLAWKMPCSADTTGLAW